MQNINLDNFDYLNCQELANLELKFPEEITLQDKELMNRLSQPGIFAFYCLITNYIFFRDGSDVSLEIYGIIYDLQYNQFEASPSLISDYKRFDFKGFVVILFALGPEWEDSEKREKELCRLKTLWSHILYSNEICIYVLKH